jgi:3-isopropylmalate/(R)-2-methylmalate dehydratase large subunit
MAETFFDKVWRRHSIQDLGDGFHLLAVDRHFVNDMAGRGFVTLNRRSLALRHPERTFAVADHTVATLWNADEDPGALRNPYATNLRENAARHGFRLFDAATPEFGIIHLVAAEQGLVLPGLTVACGDSHTCTLGALGALAWGVGQSELVHILATQASVQRKPATMRLWLDGAWPRGVTPKDLILSIIARLGVAGAAGHALEFAGPVIEALPMEGRLTVCNMATELGARFGVIAPDETTFAYLRDLPYAPKGALWDAAVADWRGLGSDKDASYDRDVRIDISDIQPQISWGTSPGQTIGIDDLVPAPDEGLGEAAAATHRAALDYVGLKAGEPIKGVPVDMVFIGSCTNGRLSDLRAAAAVARGRTVADGVTAWIAPGSEAIRRAAEKEGTAQILIDAGFGWGRSGCSMCAAAGDQMREMAAPRQRIVSTTNRNFVGRQGPGSRTHLASPAMAAASAIRGCITDPRELERNDG